MENTKINEGIDLHIDQDITEICKVANESSKVSRGMLYSVIFVSLMTFVGYWNSRNDSWFSGNLKSNLQKHDSITEVYMQNKVALAMLENNKAKFSFDSLSILEDCFAEKSYSLLQKYDENFDPLKPVKITKAEKLEAEKKYWNYYRNNELLCEKKYDLDNRINDMYKIKLSAISRVNIPILGASFDVNDLAIMAGLSLSILLYILLFAYNREYDNLSISMISISKRYSDHADETLFNEMGFKEEQLIAINKIRREYHYNYLTMNELFTLPTLVTHKKRNNIEKLATYIVLFPPIIAYTLVVVSNLYTLDIGMKQSVTNTIYNLLLGTACWMSILVITYLLIQRKIRFVNLWQQYYDNGYKYKNS